MDNEYRLDFDEIMKTVRTAEVITFRFVTVPDRLLIDNRYSEIDAPLVKLVPRAASAEERFKSLKQLRPRFKLPNKISAIWWPRYVESLAESGIWDAVMKRISDAGFAEAAASCDDLLRELAIKERSEIGNAIGGQGYRTLWPAAR
ncbi:MAG TPA: hypothetical protein VIH21_04365 [Dehalococcoidia bacterium]|jgi:hypothetical protein